MWLSTEGVAETKEAILVKVHTGVEYNDAPMVEAVAGNGEVEKCGSVARRVIYHSLDDLQWEREPRSRRMNRGDWRS